MRVCGIVCEYNPFHLGHALHIARTREALGADTAVLCVMSGSFVQRGEAAILPKHARAEMAVRCGADLVVELPVPWATASAERFALGAVSLLAATGVAGAVSFGSECGDLARLTRVAEALASDHFPDLLAAELKTGSSFPAARERAARRLLGADAALLGRPNDLLAVEYLKALRRLDAPLTPLAVRREATDHDGAAAEGFAPASFLRQRLLRGENCGDWLPAESAEVLRRELAAGRCPVTLQSAEAAVLYRLRTMTDEEYERLPDGGEGLWRRLMENGRRAAALEEVLAGTKTKRYAHARLRRMVLAAFLGLTAEDAAGLPPYLRVLAFNGRGQALLHEMRKTAVLPILTKPAAARALPPEARRVFELEAAAGDIYALLYPGADHRAGGGEWRQGPVKV